MTTFSLFEYSTTDGHGNPVEPASKVTAAIAADAPTRLQASTVYAAVVPTADMFIGIGPSGITAGADDRKVLAGETRGFAVAEGARPYVVGH